DGACEEGGTPRLDQAVARWRRRRTNHDGIGLHMRERKGGDQPGRAGSDHGGVMQLAGRGDANLPLRSGSGDPEQFAAKSQ
ncbi:MAG TPA: hypothetical protein VIB38_11170, partial [Aestuariivirgaceae bacterium]